MLRVLFLPIFGTKNISVPKYSFVILGAKFCDVEEIDSWGTYEISRGSKIQVIMQLQSMFSLKNVLGGIQIYFIFRVLGTWSQKGWEPLYWGIWWSLTWFGGQILG